MNNPFIDNPVRLKVINISSFSPSSNVLKSKREVIWLNNDSNKIMSLWKNKDEKALKKLYAPNVIRRFKAYLSNSNTNTQTVKGGVDDTDTVPSAEIHFDDDELEGLLSSDISEIDSYNKKSADEKMSQEAQYYSFVQNVFIFPEDNIATLKMKIYVATGVPPYRQHLWYNIGARSYPLSYKIQGREHMSVNINSIKTHDQFYENIPIDPEWYNEKEFMSITALDEITLLDLLYKKYEITDYYMVDLNDFIDPIRGTIETIIKKDSYTTDLIYYSFIAKYWPMLTKSIFGEYVKDENSISEKYPDMSPNSTNVRKKYITETSLIAPNYVPTLNPDKFDIPIMISITNSVITVSDNFTQSNFVLHMRNLFDVFDLNNVVTYAICKTEIDGKSVMFTKQYKTTKIPNMKIATNTILFNLVIEGHGNMQLIIGKKGSYKILSNWRADQYFGFAVIREQINKFISPVIDKINTYGSLVVSHLLPLPTMNNSVFTDIDLSLFWKNSITSSTFSNIMSLLDKHVVAGILTPIKKDTSNIASFYFHKGMFKYDTKRYAMLNPVKNQYMYLTDSSVKQKHHILTTSTKRMLITHRFSDVKIDFTGLKQQEFISFYIYILRFLESVPRTKEVKQASTDKQLKQLKEKDPLLYEFKKVYNSDLVYSKLCQKQKQPLIHNEYGKNRVKFWNFTTNSPAYYSCPNPKYPHLNFMINSHPENFCLPCCYKLPPSKNPTEAKAILYKTCMEEKKYFLHKTNISKSRYVMSYGKAIEPGRLSKLPEDSLESLFYDTFSSTDTVGIDEECIKNKGYFIFGVPQHVQNVSNIGVLFAVSHAVGKNILDFIAETIIKVRKKSNCWNILLYGLISSHFATFDAFLDEIRDVFIGTHMSSFSRWNELFIDIAKIYWGISVIHFQDINGSISLKVPGNIKYLDDYKQDGDHLILLEKNNEYNPIYVVYKEAYFKVGTIDTKLFSPSHDIISIIWNMVKTQIDRTAGSAKCIDLHVIKKFAVYSPYSIVRLYINTSNHCYAVAMTRMCHSKTIPKFSDNIAYQDITDKVNNKIKKARSRRKIKEIYFSITESVYKLDKTPICFGTPNPSCRSDIKTMIQFLEEFNTFNKNYGKYKESKLRMKNSSPQERYSLDLPYASVGIDKWLYLKKTDMIIGFITNELYNYITPTPPKKIQAVIPKANDIGFVIINYDPTCINTILHKGKPPTDDIRSQELDGALYRHNLYNILILEFIEIMNKKRNTPLRNKIVSYVNTFSKNKPDFDKLQDLLTDYPDDLAIIRKIILDNLMMPPAYGLLTKSSSADDILVDYNKISVKPVLSKKDILDVICNSTFVFDAIFMTKFQKMSHKELVKELKHMFSSRTINKEPIFVKRAGTGDEFPNMLASCSDNHPYCEKNKFMIKNDKLNELIDILASDILNPAKIKYMFSPAFTKNTMDFFKFRQRPNETIYITM